MAEYVRSGGWLTIIDARVKILKWPGAKRRTNLLRGRDTRALPSAAELVVTMASPAGLPAGWARERAREKSTGHLDVFVML
jgi:hypothetical protein